MKRARWFVIPVLFLAITAAWLVSRSNGGGLDALAWMDTGTLVATDGSVITFKGDHEAINWLNDHVSGSPVIAEASFGPYRCNGSRISIATGLPGVIGWANPHESQQRPPTDFAERIDDLHTLYTSMDPERKRQIIHKYGIEYVIIGPLEMLYPRIEGNDCVPTGSQAGIYAFNLMIGVDLVSVFSADGTTILQVVPPRPPSSGTPIAG